MSGCGHTQLYICAHFGDHQPLKPCLWCERDRLQDALIHAVSCIQTWHNMGLNAKDSSEMWKLYWRAAPEMKPIREALSGAAV